MPEFWKDLRGKRFTKEQVAATALEYSQTYLMILTALKDSPNDIEFGALIRKVVQEQINLGRVNIMVMVIEKDSENIETGMEFIVKGKVPTGVMSTDKAPEVSMTAGIEVFYDGQNYPKATD